MQENIEVEQSTNTSLKAKRKTGIKRFLPRSLLGRSLLILVTPMLLIQIVSTVVFLDNHWQKMLDRLAYAVAGEITVIARAIEDEASQDELKKIMGYVSQNLDLLISYEPSRLLKDEDFSDEKFAIWESIVINTLSVHLDDQLRRPYYIYADFDEKWVEVTVQLEDGLLNVILPERRLFSSSGYIFLFWMFGTSLFLFFVAVLFMRNQIRPIRRLAIAAEWFGRGRDVKRFKIEGASEVRQAGQAFLDMRRRIKRQISQRTIMLAGVSHDLRTPLTRIKLGLEMIDENDDVKALKDDVVQMQRMIDGYLDFIRGEEEEPLLHVSLIEFVNKLDTDFKRQGYNIKWDIPEYIQFSIREMAFERCLSNIITNATKYAENIWVRAFITDNERVQIEINDDGPGIDESLYDEVFKPFFRVDSSRSSGTGAVGLGLSIAMDVVHNHGGRIWLEKSEQGGLKVIIKLPI